MLRLDITTISLLAVATIGCSGRPARVPLADIDYDESARQAVARNDASGDGAVTREESLKSPALVAAFERIDTNDDNSLSELEVAAYLQDLQQGGVAMVSWSLRVMLDGKPLPGATVRLEPADFLQPGVLPAEGVTDANGLVTLAVDEEHRPHPHARVVHCGLYNVLVSKRQGDREVLPDRPPLGLEVRPEGQADYSGAVINLKGS